MNPKRLCEHCGEEVWWSFPRESDACFECGEEIGNAEAAMANWFVREIEKRARAEEARLAAYFADLKKRRYNRNGLIS